jgi:catechol 2,3-dioxygenase-like lactoylglutathione lyase family enzyme
MAIAHVTLPTRDLRRTVEFFEAAVGWRRIDRPGNIGVPAAWLEIAPGQEAHVVEIADFETSPFEREYGRHIAVSFPAASFPLLRQRLEQHGAELIAATRPTPFERFFFRDPNGYVFEVVAEERTPEGSDPRVS